MELSVGVDIGTTATKVVALDESGLVVSEVSLKTPVAQDEFGQVHRPEDLLAVAEEAVRKCVVSVPGGRLTALAVASVGEEGVPLDAQGRHLYPAIVWHDRRTATLEAEWEQHHDVNRAYDRTGLKPDPIRTLFKLMWLGDNIAGLRRRVTTWLSVSEYLAYAWSGERAFAPSQAARTFLWDLRGHHWCEDWIDALNIPKLELPSVRPSGSVLGSLRSNALRNVPRGPDAVVVLAGHDHSTGAVAASLTAGAALDSMGTAESVMVATETVETSARAMADDLEFGLTVGKGPYWVSGVAHSGADLARWADVFQRSVDELENLAHRAPVGAGGTLYYPSRRMGAATASVLGLSSGQDVGGLYRAILEGWAFEMRRTVQALERASGGEIHRLKAVGGGARSRLSLQIRASLLGTPVEVIRGDKAVAVGAASMALMGARRGPPGLAPTTVVEPDPEWTRSYGDVWHRWQESHPVPGGRTVLGTRPELRR